MFLSMTIFQEWAHDPAASAALVIAIVAGTWTLAQFRPVARERRRETYGAMDAHYGELRELRGLVVPTFPPLLAAGQEALLEASHEGQYAVNDNTAMHSARIASLVRDWKKWGVSFTSAYDILSSEAKFRCLLWSVILIRNWRADGSLWLNGREYKLEILSRAEHLVHDLNAFLFHYEAGNYPAKQTLGLLHRSFASVAKAMEPIVWERSTEARWGRRVLRIGIAAQGYNDVTPIHAVSDLKWNLEDGSSQLIHPRRKDLVFGKNIYRRDIPGSPKYLGDQRLWIRSLYWACVGKVSPTPRLSVWSYGGWRMHRHRRNENRLAGLIDFAIIRGITPLDFSWEISTLINQQIRAAKGSGFE